MAETTPKKSKPERLARYVDPCVLQLEAYELTLSSIENLM